MYEYADKILRAMRKEFIRLFNNFGSQASFDELNVLSSAKALYRELADVAKRGFLLIANRAYNNARNDLRTPEVQGSFDISAGVLTEHWLLGWLNDYNPVTKYVYMHEIERKCARFAESIIASPTRSREIETGLRYWSAMVTHYAIDVTDKATVRAYRDNGVERVIWITVPDERRCGKCLQMHGRIYDIDKIPPKPHLMCRCYTVPYPGGDVL